MPKAPYVNELVEAERVIERARQRDYYHRNREKVRARKKADYERNRERELTRGAKYRAENPEKVKRATQRWTENNPEKRAKIINDYISNREKTDPQFKMIRNLRARMRSALKKQGTAKTSLSFH